MPPRERDSEALTRSQEQFEALLQDKLQQLYAGPHQRVISRSGCIYWSLYESSGQRPDYCNAKLTPLEFPIW
jgi:hypothetical protein